MTMDDDIQLMLKYLSKLSSNRIVIKEDYVLINSRRIMITASLLKSDKVSFRFGSYQDLLYNLQREGFVYVSDRVIEKVFSHMSQEKYKEFLKGKKQSSNESLLR